MRQTDPNRTKIIVGSTLAGAFVIIVVAVIIAILIKRRERKKHKAEFEHNLKLLNLQSASKMVVSQRTRDIVDLLSDRLRRHHREETDRRGR